MRKFVTLFLLLGLCIHSVSGQAYIVKRSGDTLRGKLNIFTNNNKEEMVTLREGKKRTNYKVTELTSFVDNKGAVYRSLFISGKYRFAKEERLGAYVSLYRYTDQSRSENQAFSQQVLLKKHGESLDIPGIIGFRGAMSEYFSDYEVLVNDIKSRKYKSRDLYEIMDSYNEYIVDRGNAGIPRASTEEPKNLTSEESSRLEKVADLKTLIDYSDLANKTDILEILKDVETRLSAGNDIPNYLSKALKSELKSDKKLTKLLEEILKK